MRGFLGSIDSKEEAILLIQGVKTSQIYEIPDDFIREVDGEYEWIAYSRTSGGPHCRKEVIRQLIRINSAGETRILREQYPQR